MENTIEELREIIEAAEKFETLIDKLGEEGAKVLDFCTMSLYLYEPQIVECLGNALDGKMKIEDRGDDDYPLEVSVKWPGLKIYALSDGSEYERDNLGGKNERI